jgi:hypothetical protein
MKSNTKSVLRSNVLGRLGKLKELRAHETGVSRLVALGFSNGTAQRILDPEQDVRLVTLEQLAAKMKVKPWQLLVPEGPQAALQDLVTSLEVSPRAEHIARRFDAIMTDDARRLAYALIDQVLQQAEFLAQRSNDVQKPKEPPPPEGSAPQDPND